MPLDDIDTDVIFGTHYYDDELEELADRVQKLESQMSIIVEGYKFVEATIKEMTMMVSQVVERINQQLPSGSPN